MATHRDRRRRARRRRGRPWRVYRQIESFKRKSTPHSRRSACGIMRAADVVQATICNAGYGLQVHEGIEVFDQLYDKVYSASTSTQKVPRRTRSPVPRSLGVAVCSVRRRHPSRGACRPLGAKSRAMKGRGVRKCSTAPSSNADDCIPCVGKVRGGPEERD